MFAKYTVLAAAAMLAAGAANAQVGVTADLGSTGVGFHVVVPMETYLNGRFGANYFRHDFDKTSGGVDYDIKGKLQTFDVLFDWYLTEGSSFHLTGGLVYNGNKFNAKAKPNGLGGFTLNGHAYTAADVGLLTGRIDYRKAAPYLGIGWGNALARSSRWTTNIDLGVFYQGNPNVQLASVGCTVSNTVCKALASDVAVERLRLRDDVDALKVYPVVRASIGYQF
ncbi:hypothetical protein [Massilia sp.]|uniref:hypothetical protein n=1 Tax=Massilia sp. TaxID=1882437 RepID=UPI00352D8A34